MILKLTKIATIKKTKFFYIMNSSFTTYYIPPYHLINEFYIFRIESVFFSYSKLFIFRKLQIDIFVFGDF